MWHVDEGALHAYLDGALDSLPASEAARIREHIASCPACGARLEEERALRAEAEAILSGAAPDAGPLPPFEELRAMARARRRTGSGSRLQRLSWAATIVLAMGAGWMLRGSQGWRFTGAPEVGSTMAEPRLEAEAPGAVEVAESIPTPLAEERQLADAAGGVPSVVEGGASPAAAEAPAAETAERPRLAQAEAAPVASQAAAPSAPPTDVDQMARSLAATRERVAAMTAERPQPVEDLRARGEVVGVSAAMTARGPAPAAPASVMVPGLVVFEVSRAGGAFPEGTMRVLQRLDRDTLELFHLPEGSAAPDSAAELPDGRAQAVAPLGGGWLVGRARVTPERLRALLALVRGSDGDV